MATLLIVIHAFYFIQLPSIKSGLHDQKRAEVRELVNSAWGAVDMQYVLEQSGELSREQAQEAALRFLCSMRLGPERGNRFCICGKDGRLLSPSGGESKCFAKEEGWTEIVSALAEKARNHGEGYVEIAEQSGQNVPKLIYVRAFAPWDWVIGFCVYTDETKPVIDHLIDLLNLSMLLAFGLILVTSILVFRVGRGEGASAGPSQKRLHSIFDQTNQFIGLLTLDGHTMTVNRPFLNFIGMLESEIVGQQFWDTPWWRHSEESQERLKRAIAEAREGETVRFGLSATNVQGDPRSIDFLIKPIMNDEGGIAYLMAEGHDITPRVKAEEALRYSEESYRELVEYAQSIIVRWTTEGTIVFANEFALNLFGYDEAEIVGSNILGTLMPRNQESEERWFSFVEEIGSSRKEAFSLEKGCNRKDGSEIWISWTNKPIFDYKDRFAEVLSVGINITDRKKAQDELEWLNEELELRVNARTLALEKSLESLKQAQEQLVESAKMASLGGLVAGVAHEINTPLGIGVTTISYLDDKAAELAERYDSGKVKRSDFEKFIKLCRESTSAISMNLERASELIQSFKQVAVDQTSEQRRKFKLKNYIQEVLRSLHSKYKDTSHTIEVTGTEISLLSYPGAIMQVLTNLLMNALTHAFEDRENGHVTIDVAPLEKGVRFTFIDDGQGMNEMIKSRIFDPFFTTKRASGGTGLGLHIVYNLVTQKLGGTISCESEAGKGTSFIIELPREAPVI
ncbi:PAS domain S-box protein [Salidesulfovibrio onnuriiensis]|uniref:PAS domain S-box protein n=1 Tax=Salidesulfovibrio onnuriiensis TaxID=2583823 RepID=UPI00164F3BE7|nr:PAS domain S-box protein [Salidesulfovibrio onnuriiensis]